MSAQTLTDFLLARIAEDERDLDLIGEKRHDWHARWLAECEAKRRIVTSLAPFSDLGEQRQDDLVLRWLAEPYADRPDYREEWRP